MADDNKGSVLGGSIWMIVISVLLCWLPGVGGFIAGLVGGMKAGGIGSALMAWLLSSILIGALFATLGTLLTGMIVIGALAGLGGLMLALIDSGGRLLGALIGGFLA
ncbi:MAG TPA: hypothetical protein VFV27_07245 [Nevskiaceae bacterium]|nr:hypothetical protein [Nevskiaceae bacterium]